MNRYKSNGDLYWKYTYTYDSYDNMIEETKYNSKERLKRKITYNYEYDCHSNWINKSILKWKSGVPKTKEITEREIEYYD